MIAFLRGRVAEVAPDRAVIDVGGVGFAVFASGRQLSAFSRQVGEQVTVQTYLHVREDALQIYGFADAREREFFQALIAVSGVGPKVALAVLSGYPVNELELAVARDDTKKFESISGVGKRLAQRLVVELKDRVAVGVEGLGGAPTEGDQRAFMLARSALQNLGVGVREAEDALHGAPDDAPFEDLVKYALKRSKESE
jgi:Holliday junction DNA helicase RuvA